MKTQEDSQVRVVALENLRAMCADLSGMCYRFDVIKVTRSRVHVSYNNPNEYGTDDPMVAIFPCYPSAWPDDSENPRVVLNMLRVLNDSWDGDGWQAFDQLINAPRYWRIVRENDEKWTADARDLRHASRCHGCGESWPGRASHAEAAADAADHACQYRDVTTTTSVVPAWDRAR